MLGMQLLDGTLREALAAALFHRVDRLLQFLEQGQDALLQDHPLGLPETSHELRGLGAGKRRTSEPGIEHQSLIDRIVHDMLAHEYSTENHKKPALFREGGNVRHPRLTRAKGE